MHFDADGGTNGHFAANYCQGTSTCRFKASQLRTFWIEKVDLAAAILER